MAEIHFCTTAEYVEFASESRTACYAIRIYEDGHEESLVNSVLTQQPMRRLYSPFAHDLLQFFQGVRADAVSFLNENHESARRALWWALHDGCAKHNSAAKEAVR